MKTSFYAVVSDKVNISDKLTNFTSSDFKSALMHLLENINNDYDSEFVDTDEITAGSVNIANVEINGDTANVHFELLVTLRPVSPKVEDYFTENISTDRGLHGGIYDLLVKNTKVSFTVLDYWTQLVYEFTYSKT